MDSCNFSTAAASTLKSLGASRKAADFSLQPCTSVADLTTVSTYYSYVLDALGMFNQENSH